MKSVVSNHASDTADLVGQVADEFLKAVEAGEQPEVEEYAARYPEVAAILRDVLPALALIKPPHSCGASGAESNGHVAEDLTDKTLGDFRLVREIGRGGMGVVYEAEQISLGRTVALKVLPFAAMLDSRQLARFRNEARAAASLHHTNIVPVYFVGSERGVHFYAMQFIKGDSLARVIEHLRGPEDLPDDDRVALASEVCQCPPAAKPSGSVLLTLRREDEASRRSVMPTLDEPTTDWSREAAPDGTSIPSQATGLTPQSPAPSPQSLASTEAIALLSTARSTSNSTYFRTIAELGIQAAEALDYAHEQGVIHRDIKPANLLLDETARLWITDFGLARLESDAGMTMTGDLIGTLRYMSPEQALAKRVVVDHRTDVYSLGATLYELLALRPPFASPDRQKLLKQIAFDDPPALRKLSGQIPVELETIVDKAIRKNPTDRYATARDLAEDLRSVLQNKPIKAKPPTRREKLVKWSHRHPTALLSSSVFATTLAIVLGIAAFLINGAKDEERQWREQADQQTQLALGTLEFVVNDIQFKLPGVRSAEKIRTSLLAAVTDRLKEVARRLGDQHSKSDLAAMRSHITLAGIFNNASVFKSPDDARFGSHVTSVISTRKNADESTSERSTPVGQDSVEDAIAYARSLGQPSNVDAALEQLIIAYEIGKQLLHDDPRNTDVTHEMLEVYYRLTATSSNVDVLSSVSTRGIEIGEDLLRENPRDYFAKRHVAHMYTVLGESAYESNVSDTGQCRRSLQRSLEIYQALIEEEPENGDDYRSRANAVRSALGQLNCETGNVTEGRDQLQRSVEYSLERSKEASREEDRPLELAIYSGRLAAACLNAGDLGAARSAAETALNFVNKLPSDDPTHLRALIHAYGAAVPVYRQSGDLDAARRAAEIALDKRRMFEEFYPGAGLPPDTDGEILEAVDCLEWLGDQKVSQADFSAAREDFRKCAEIYESKYVRELSHIEISGPQMFRTFEKLGDAELRLGHVAAAREAMKKAVGRRDQRIELLIVEHSNEYEELGDICMQAGATGTASIAYEKALAVDQERAKQHPQNGAAQHALVLCYERLGDANRRRDRRHFDAVGDYQKAVRIAMELLQRDPRTRQARRDLAVAHLRVADLNRENGDAAAARGDYRQALAGFLKLADDDPKDVAAQAELAYCYGECGYLQQDEEEFPSAIRCFEKGVAVLEKMRDDETLDTEPKYDTWLEGQRTNLEICKRLQLAVENLEPALKQWPGYDAEFLAMRGRVLARRSRAAGATAAAEKLAALEPLTSTNSLHAAEVYALCLIHSTNPSTFAAPDTIGQRRHDWSRARELVKQAFDLWLAPKAQTVAPG